MEIFWRVVYEFRRIAFSMQVYFLTLKIIRLAREIYMNINQTAA